LLLPSIATAAWTFSPCSHLHIKAGWRMVAIGGVDPSRLLTDLVTFAKSL
jgi:hypothetical protein